MPRQRSNSYWRNNRTIESGVFSAVRPGSCVTMQYGRCKEMFFSVLSVQRLYHEDQRDKTEYSPCGGGVEYFHRNPASRRRRWKGNPEPWGITRPPCSWGTYTWGSGPPDWGSLECERVKYGRESLGTRIWEWLRCRGPVAIVNDRSIFSSERILLKEYDLKCSVKKKSWS
jgi:hypothetical protein